MLLRRDDLLHVIDHGEGNDQRGDQGLLLVAVVKGVGFIQGTEEQDGYK